ncbi:MAG: outer membrane protein assembly factor BamD [Saprospiraceae bacterium]|nr:outer membrane protein assembly factor BamD [Candidatus Parvibacillus calidus]
MKNKYLHYLCALMMRKHSLVLILLAMMAFASCKSEYEKLRASSDVALVYKKALEYFSKKDYYKAQNLLEQILGRYRGKKEAEDLYVKYAYTHYYQGNYILAASYFQNFANTYLTSPLREEAAYMSAYSNYLQSPDYKLDQTYTGKAIDELQIFVNTFPKSERVKEANKLIDELRAKLEKKAFEEGVLYYNLKQYQSATITFNNMLKEFPDSKNVEKIRYFIVKSNFTLAENSIYAKKLVRYQETLLSAELFKEKFPRSKDRKEIDSILKETKIHIKKLENDGHQDKSAGNRS